LRDAATDVARGWQSPGADRFHTDFMNFTEQIEPLARAYGAASDFGGVRLQTNADDMTGIGGHSDYFEDDTESLENVVRVVRGDIADLTIKHASFGDHVGEFAHDRYRNLTGENVTDPALDGIQDHLPVPKLVDGGIDAYQHLQNVAGGVVETGVRNAVDKTIELGDDVIETGDDIIDDVGDALEDLDPRGWFR